MDARVERDAQEFGRLFTLTGWPMGLLVARCVQSRQGRRTDLVPRERSAKVTGAEFARAAGVSRNTITAYLQAWDKAAVAGVVAVRSDLQPGVDPGLNVDALPSWDEYYEPRGGGRQSGDDEWLTRPTFVEAARDVLGVIDLDPASNERAQQDVRARRYFTKETDGLFTSTGRPRRWSGRVFLNPPFSRGKEFGGKLLQHYDRGDVTAAVFVLNAWSFDTAWFQPFYVHAIHLSTQSAFYKPGAPDRSGPFAWAAFVYLGREFNSFVDRFAELGCQILKDPTDREWQKRFSRRPGSRA